MDDTKVVEDCLTKILHDTLIFGTVVGVAVDWDEYGQKIYGLRISRCDARISRKAQQYVIWFMADEEGNGPGGFQIQKIS